MAGAVEKDDTAWVEQMASITLGLDREHLPPKLIEMWCQSLITARRQASESIGDIQVVVEPEVYRDAESKSAFASVRR